jgi:hypothetical protein
MKKHWYTYIFLLLLLGLTVGVTYAAFADRAEVLGSTFSVGSADIKLLLDVFGLPVEENLADELMGPAFVDIDPEWVEDYLVTLYNPTASNLDITTHADYETANDPDDLRQDIFVTIYEWEDLNGNNFMEEEELVYEYGTKSIVKWKTEGFELAVLEPGGLMPLVLRFSSDVPNSKQGASAVFDFEFDSVGAE